MTSSAKLLHIGVLLEGILEEPAREAPRIDGGDGDASAITGRLHRRVSALSRAAIASTGTPPSARSGKYSGQNAVSGEFSTNARPRRLKTTIGKFIG